MKRAVFTCTNPRCELGGKGLWEYTPVELPPRACPKCLKHMHARYTEAGVGDLDSYDLDAIRFSPRGDT